VLALADRAIMLLSLQTNNEVKGSDDEAMINKRSDAEERK
jgi:hypothetical protein